MLHRCARPVHHGTSGRLEKSGCRASRLPDLDCKAVAQRSVGDSKQRHCLLNERGAGITALGGGDYDGDTLFVTANRHLLNYVDATEAAVRAIPKEEADAVKNLLTQDTKTAWAACDPSARSLQYLQHVQETPTPNVRGVATWYAEIARAAAAGCSTSRAGSCRPGVRSPSVC